jgi:hypothetical protein
MMYIYSHHDFHVPKRTREYSQHTYKETNQSHVQARNLEMSRQVLETTLDSERQHMLLLKGQMQERHTEMVSMLQEQVCLFLVFSACV